MSQKLSMKLSCQLASIFGFSLRRTAKLTLGLGLIALTLSPTLLTKDALADGLVVRQNITIDGQQLLLGDVFPQANGNKGQIVMTGIQPGETRSIDKFQLLKIVNKHQLNWVPKDNFTAIKVVRTSQSIDQERLKDLIEDRIIRTANLEFDSITVKLLLFNHELPLSVQNEVLYDIANFRYKENSGHFQGHVNISTEGKTYPIKFQGSVILQKKVPTLKRPLPRGTTIYAKDVIFRMEKLNNIHANTITEKEDVIGMQTTHHIRANKTFTQKDLRQPILVKTKQKVTMRLKSNHMIISTQGIALESGVKGDIIDIRNSNSGIIVSGTIISAETVEISVFGQTAQNTARPTQALTQVN